MQSFKKISIVIKNTITAFSFVFIVENVLKETVSVCIE